MKTHRYKRAYVGLIILFGFAVIIGFFRMQYGEPLLRLYIQKMPLGQQQIVILNISQRAPHIARVVLDWAQLPSDRQHDLDTVLGKGAYGAWGEHGFSICGGDSRIRCYQGVMTGMIGSLGYSPETVRYAAMTCSSVGKGNVQDCAQAAGYTILWLNTYWYIESLQYCDKTFNDPSMQSNCWIGVSHENVNRAGDALHGLFDAPWTSDNMYYPCDSIPLVYQPACVSEQMLVIRRTLYKNDVNKSSAYCLHFVEDDTKRTCMSALIRSMVSEQRGNSYFPHVSCAELPNEYKALCINESGK